MAKNEIRNENYVNIAGWMRNMPAIENNNELMAYALIYGFSQTDGQFLSCRQSYIAEWLGIARENCSKILQRMEQKKLIGKKLVKKNGAIRQYKYYAILPIFTSDVTSHDERRNITRTSDVTSHVTSDVTSHNDINIYNNNLYISRAPTRGTKKTANSFNNFEQRDYDFEKLEKELLRE